METHRHGIAVEGAITVHEGSVLLGVEPVLEPDDLVAPKRVGSCAVATTRTQMR